MSISNKKQWIIKSLHFCGMLKMWPVWNFMEWKQKTPALRSTYRNIKQKWAKMQYHPAASRKLVRWFNRRFMTFNQRRRCLWVCLTSSEAFSFTARAWLHWRVVIMVLSGSTPANMLVFWVGKTEPKTWVWIFTTSGHRGRTRQLPNAQGQWNQTTRVLGDFKK